MAASWSRPRSLASRSSAGRARRSIHSTRSFACSTWSLPLSSRMRRASSTVGCVAWIAPRKPSFTSSGRSPQWARGGWGSRTAASAPRRPGGGARPGARAPPAPHAPPLAVEDPQRRLYDDPDAEGEEHGPDAHRAAEQPAAREHAHLQAGPRPGDAPAEAVVEPGHEAVPRAGAEGGREGEPRADADEQDAGEQLGPPQGNGRRRPPGGPGGP